MQKLKTLLSEENQMILLRFNDRSIDKMAAAANTAYMRGFAECLQVILYLLTAK